MTWKETAAALYARNPIPLWCERLCQSRAGQWCRRTLTFLQAHWFWTQIAMILLYRLALDIQYIAVMSPLYGYAGFTTDLSLDRYLCSWLVVIGFAPFLARLNDRENPSSVLLTLINYLYFLPLTSYVGCKGTEWSFFVVAVLYWTLLLLLQHYIPTLRLAPIPTRFMRKVYSVLTMAAAAFVMFVSGKYTGFRMTFDIINVYEIRAEAKAYQMSGIVSYALAVMSIVLAVIILFWLVQRKYWVVAALAVVFMFLFSIAAHKSQFALLLLILACYGFYRPWMLHWCGGILTLATGAALAERLIGGTYYLSAYFFRRMMYIPVQISDLYCQFFAANPPDLFRQGIMGKLSFDSIYAQSIPYLIAETQGKISSANNGMLGDMFANLPGILGLLLMPLILVICFRVIDATAHHLPSKMTISVCLYYAVTFINCSWSTVLLTHGFLIACLLLYFFPEENARKC